MKKLFVSTLLVTSITSAYVATPVNAAKTASNCIVKKASRVKLPNVTNAKTLTQMKAGKFVFNGIKYSDTYAKAIKTFGNPVDVAYDRANYGTVGTLHYDKFTMMFYDKNREAKLTNIKGAEMTFEVGTKANIKKSTLEKTIGKATRKDLTSKTTEFDVYGNHLAVAYKKVKGTWLVEGIIYGKEMKLNEYQSTKGKLSNLKEKPLSSKDLKAMIAKKYQLKGIKLGMTPADVKKLVGFSNHEQGTGSANYQVLSQFYGDMDWVEMHYESPKCNGQYQLEHFTFDYGTLNEKASNVVKSLGKPKKVETINYMDGKKKVTDKIYYYKNLQMNTTAKKSGEIITSIVYGA